jgi:hypothetical protein
MTNYPDPRREQLRATTLTNLREHEVLMLDGHFDYGNGYHGPRVSQSPPRSSGSRR